MCTAIHKSTTNANGTNGIKTIGILNQLSFDRQRLMVL